jgi:hypothetical protein
MDSCRLSCECIISAIRRGHNCFALALESILAIPMMLGSGLLSMLRDRDGMGHGVIAPTNAALFVADRKTPLISSGPSRTNKRLGDNLSHGL